MKQQQRVLLKNKIVASVLLAANIGIVFLMRDITFLVMMLPTIVALYFAKRDYIGMEDWDYDE
ncbi:MAG: hypothetical protein U0M06_04235 [Clostridia bacterium]|jgi:hypothetical protein|nr:hypothetical protein [Clostridia bacterium]